MTPENKKDKMPSTKSQAAVKTPKTNPISVRRVMRAVSGEATAVHRGYSFNYQKPA